MAKDIAKPNKEDKNLNAKTNSNTPNYPSPAPASPSSAPKAPPLDAPPPGAPKAPPLDAPPPGVVGLVVIGCFPFGAPLPPNLDLASAPELPGTFRNLAEPSGTFICHLHWNFWKPSGTLRNVVPSTAELIIG